MDDGAFNRTSSADVDCRKVTPSLQTKERREMPLTDQLPEHGRIACSICHHPQPYGFDRTRTEVDGWRITNNPMAWGGSEPEVVVLGFSKGPTQAGALTSAPHEAIAYKGGRAAVAKILHHIGLLERADARLVDALIANPSGPVHFGSVIRCTVERRDDKDGSWEGTGGGMLDRFVRTKLGRNVTERCGTRFLSRLPERTRLVVMLGLGSKLNYVRSCRSLFERVRPGRWQNINEVSYTDGRIIVVHTEHFRSQGALLPQWLSGDGHDRGRLGLLAREAARSSRLRGQIAAPILPARPHRVKVPGSAVTPVRLRSEPEPITSEEPQSSETMSATGDEASSRNANAPQFVFRPGSARAYGQPLPDGRFLVCAGSTAVRSGSSTMKRDQSDRDELVLKGILAPDIDPSMYRFAKDHVFGSSSKAAGIIKDGNASGPSLWRQVKTGKTLRDYLTQA